MKKSCLYSMLVLLSLAATACAQPISVGPVNQQEPPAREELVEPDSDDGIGRVGLRAEVSGEVTDLGAAKVYVLVNPLSNLATRNTWWVQQSARVRDGKFRADCQFGEGSQGRGEYFAIIALISDRPLDVGQQVNGLPRAKAYSKLKIVKRTF